MISKLKPIHPFAARMAPEIAFEALKDLKKSATVLDPMVGSGTVLRTVTELGYNGLGYDLDPLAVLMTEVWTTNIDPNKFLERTNYVINEAQNLDPTSVQLPWIDSDPKTTEFINFWFAEGQKNDLKRLSFILNNNNNGIYNNALKLVLSKQIITKTKGASLAADVSHSRPHKVRANNDFEVLLEFKKSCLQLARIFEKYPPKNKVTVKLGDARKLNEISEKSVSAIITSPPYLNAIDYMRGHKLALVWLGFKVEDLSNIRGKSIGAEKKPDETADLLLAQELTKNLSNIHQLSSKNIKMIYRYALDMFQVISESKRVLEKGGQATFVIGNSCLKGIYVENSLIAENCADLVGLNLMQRKERELPGNRRYLPPPKAVENSGLEKRMRTEVILSFINK